LRFLLQGLFSQKIADIIAHIEKMKIDKRANLVSVSIGGVCAIDEFLAVVVKGEEDFIFHV
jgi:hypothetical protein